jgi:sRNA-binding carbon storage regulator CsrA
MLNLTVKCGDWLDITLPSGEVGSIQVQRDGERIRLAIDLPRSVQIYRSDIPIERRRGPLGYVLRDDKTF